MKPIPEDLAARYRRRELTSTDLAKLLNVHPVTIRRNIKHDPPEKKFKKAELIAIREKFREKHAHLPPKTLQTLLHVSYSTALRIRKKYKNA